MATTKKTAAKAETKTTAKKAAAKTETKAAAKTATKKAAATKTAAKKTETKAAAKTTATKKAATKTTAAKKTAAKKTEPKFELFIQFGGATVAVADIEKNVKKVVKGKNAYTVYVKPEESKAYIVADGETTGMDVFFVAD